MLLLATPAAAEPLKLRLGDLDRIVGADAGMHLGRALALGDLDCDGERDDLVLGAADPASIWVWYGLLDPDDAWPSPSQPNTINTDTADVRIDGVEDSFGTAVAVGDLGGPCDSLAVGAPDELLGEGTVRIFHGPLPSGCEGPCFLQASVHEDASILGVELGRMGASLAIAGDLDGVGHDDLLVGEPEHGGGDGRVLLFGANLGQLSGGTVLSVLNAGLQIFGSDWDGAAIGSALQAADVDGDGEDEALIASGGGVVLSHDLTAASYDPLSVPPVVSWADFTANLLAHHGYVLGAGLPMAVHALDQPRPALWVGTPNYLLGVGAVVGLLPDIQNRYDLSTADAAVRLEGVALEDANFGRQVDGADVDGDGVQDLIVTSPLWTDGTGTVIDSIGPRAGRTFVYDGNTLGALFDDVCAPPPCRVIGEDEAFLEIQGRQEYEGFPASVSDTAYLGVRPLAAADRLLLAAPLRDDDVSGLEAGAVAGLTLDLDRDGVLLGIDCDDFDATVYPGAPPICDDVPDQDCDGAIDTDERDADLDGFSPCAGDCDDDDPLRAPDHEEAWCDGRDNDCVDDALDAPEQDADGDGVRPCEGDCDDDDPARTPNAEEACNGIDDDCDQRVDEDFDADGDGYPDADLDACDGRPAETLDCDDADPWRNPGASEADGIDDADCDGAVEWKGGCACDASPEHPGGPWLLLPLLLLLRRRRRLRLAPLALVPLVMGQALVLPATDEDLVVVGDSGVSLPFSMTVVPDPADPALVVSRPDAAYSFTPAHGWGYVYRPSQQLPRLIDTDDRMFFGSGDALFTLYAGHALATGDINGDGLADLVATAPTRNGWGGRTWSWLGKEAGDCPGGAVERSGFCQGKGFRSTSNFNDAGWTASVADLDDDGYDDIIVADPTNWTGVNWGVQTFGAVWVFWGQEDFSPGASSDAAKLTGTEPRSLGSFARAEADWNCDGLPDLAVGCDPALTSGCVGAEDELTLLLNDGARLVSSTLESHRPLVTLTGVAPTWEMGVVQVPDVGDDGCDDVLLSLPAPDAGRVVFVPVTPTLDWFPTGGDTATHALADVTGWELAGPEGAHVGAAVELVRWTDPTGPWPDLLVGMPGAASELGDRHRPGRVAFLRGDTVFGGLSGAFDVLDVADVVFEGRQEGEGVGAHLATWADQDGDGLADVVVGATGLDHPDGGLEAGGIYVLHSGPFSDADGDGVPGFEDCDDRRAECVDPETDCVDADGDLVMVCAGDCDDTDITIHPPRSPREWESERERCDGLDNDCDGVLMDSELDADGDGLLACADDCDDLRAEVGPGFPELCNGLDDDCDGLVDEDFDADGDGFPANGAACEGVDVDCNDRAAGVHPGAPEVPGNGRDEDCDGEDVASWPGGCACASGDPSPHGSVGLLGPLLLFLRRRRRTR